MGGRRHSTLKWEKTVPCRPNHNIISSDFPKYIPHPWKFMDGPSLMNLLIAHEYQRLWRQERDAWSKRMYPEKAENVDIVKSYVLNFSKNAKPPKPVKPKPFKMKKFEKIANLTSTRRPPGDKAMILTKKDRDAKTSEAKTA